MIKNDNLVWLLLDLKALILNNNKLSIINGLSFLTDLNTLSKCVCVCESVHVIILFLLVLSHNLFELIDISSLAALTKLSLSYNRLSNIPDTKVMWVH